MCVHVLAQAWMLALLPPLTAQRERLEFPSGMWTRKTQQSLVLDLDNGTEEKQKKRHVDDYWFRKEETECL